jgi:hypothetical protein
MEACLFEGAYHSTGRSLRWMYELNLVGTAACVNALLLDVRYTHRRLDLKEFEDLLDKIDNDEIRFTNGKRKTIFIQFGLPYGNMESLYSDLCKYVHLSSTSFDKTLDWPNLQFMPEKFDEIFPIILRTMDPVFWMETKLCSCFNGGTKGALKIVFKNNPYLEFLPLTASLIDTL